MKTPVRDQVDGMDALAYFRRLASLLKDNPPAEEDAPMVAAMARIGIVPGREFDPGKLDPAVLDALRGVPAAAHAKIMAHFADSGTLVNGWQFSLRTGRYGTDYLQRAFITAIGLGANRPEDAVYPTSPADARGEPYHGSKKYMMRFPKGQTPPVDGFWSLTMYDSAYSFVKNPINRHSVSPRTALKPNPDGSIDLLIQHDSPGPDLESNWLPAPEGDFVLMLRMYWPRPPVLDGSWKPPSVTKAD